MDQDLINNWQKIRKVFNKSFFTSLHYAFATVDKNGHPHVAPVGSLFLCKDEPKGIYFEIFVKNSRTNIENNGHVCVMAIPSSKWLWFQGLFFGKFPSPPGVRLYGVGLGRRESTEEEIKWWQKRIGITKIFRGHQLIWSNLSHVREIKFDRFEWVKLGATTKHLY